MPVQAVILASIVVLGVFGAYSAMMIILVAQALPAAIALVLLEIGNKGPDDLGFLGFTLTLSAVALMVGTWVKGEQRKMRQIKAE